MLFKCPVCGSHTSEGVAVEVPVGDELRRYCSLRCAEGEESGSARQAPLPPLPEVPRRLLVAVDGSGPSLRATELAVALAARNDGEILLLHAVDPGVLQLLPFDVALQGARRFGLEMGDLEEAMRAEGEAQLQRCLRICEQAGVPVKTSVQVMPPVRAIAEAAEGVDLVVMGSRGLGSLSGAALGSLSHRVIGETPKPVLIVH